MNACQMGFEKRNPGINSMKRSCKQACEENTKGLEGGTEWRWGRARLSRWRQQEEEDGLAVRGYACKETLESKSKEFGIG